MQVGFVGLEDPQGIRSYSGTPYCMAQALQRQGCSISFYLRLEERSSNYVRAKNKIIRTVTGKHIIRERHPVIARSYPGQINAAVAANPVDVVLGTSSFYMVTHDCPAPAIFWGDTTVAGVIGQYSYYRNVTARSLRDCHTLEQAALRSSTLAIFSNQWAADVARSHYSFDERKLRVIPYGANLFTIPDSGDIAHFLTLRSRRECELLFVGLDWKRKGAEIAVEATSILRRMGVDAHLTLVGAVPPPSYVLPDYVTLTGRIDKSTPEGQSELAALYARAHFMILPTRAECAAVSLAEASAHGVPSLSTDVGGNRTLVLDGVNGHLFPLEADAASYAEFAFRLLASPNQYSSMCWNSFERFQSELNWDVAVYRLMTEIDTVLQANGGTYACSRAS